MRPKCARIVLRATPYGDAGGAGWDTVAATRVNSVKCPNFLPGSDTPREHG